METFLGIILTLIIISYVLGKLLPFFLKWFINRKMRQFQNGEGTPFGGFNTTGSKQNSSRKEGEVRINKKNAPKRVKENVGDYVDYEEVKE